MQVKQITYISAKYTNNMKHIHIIIKSPLYTLSHIKDQNMSSFTIYLSWI